MYRAAGLPTPRLNHPIPIPGRPEPLIVDLAWPEIDLVFELELAALDPDVRPTVTSALNGVLFWGHWDDLRKSGRSIEEAHAALLLTVRAIFASIGADPDR